MSDACVVVELVEWGSQSCQGCGEGLRSVVEVRRHYMAQLGCLFKGLEMPTLEVCPGCRLKAAPEKLSAHKASRLGCSFVRAQPRAVKE